MPSLLEPSTSKYDGLCNGENGTISSRLRKRRRTASSPTETTPSAPKATSLRKTTSPNNKRISNEVALQETARDISQDAAVQNAPKRSPQHVVPFPTQDTASNTSHGNLVSSKPQADVNSEQSHTLQETPSRSPSKPWERPSYASVGPDLEAVITKIIDHGETIDHLYATQGYDDMGIVDTESFVSLGASLHLKTQSLPILDNLVSFSITWRILISQEKIGDPNLEYVSEVHL